MPTIGDMYTKDVECLGAPRHIEIDDTAGQEAYADLKREKMSTGDVRITSSNAFFYVFLLVSFPYIY